MPVIFDNYIFERQNDVLPRVTVETFLFAARMTNCNQLCHADYFKHYLSPDLGQLGFILWENVGENDIRIKRFQLHVFVWNSRLFCRFFLKALIEFDRSDSGEAWLKIWTLYSHCEFSEKLNVLSQITKTLWWQFHLNKHVYRKTHDKNKHLMLYPQSCWMFSRSQYNEYVGKQPWSKTWLETFFKSSSLNWFVFVS